MNAQRSAGEGPLENYNRCTKGAGNQIPGILVSPIVC
jgi:hypothetical protein